MGADDLEKQISDLLNLATLASQGHEQAIELVKLIYERVDNEGPEEQLLTQAQLAERLGVTTRTIRNLDLPEIRVGNRPRYRLADCLAKLPRK